MHIVQTSYDCICRYERANSIHNHAQPQRGRGEERGEGGGRERASERARERERERERENERINYLSILSELTQSFLHADLSHEEMLRNLHAMVRKRRENERKGIASSCKDRGQYLLRTQTGVMQTVNPQAPVYIHHCADNLFHAGDSPQIHVYAHHCTENIFYAGD